MGRPYLGEFEEIVLIWVGIQHEEAYGLSIANAIQEEMERSVTLSSVHTALYRLEEKGYVRSELGGATGQRGGRRKRIFIITNAGREALQQSREMRLQLWSKIAKKHFPSWEI